MRALPLLTILLMALLALPTSAARFVIVGVAGIDDRATRLQAIDLDSRAADGSAVAFDVGVLHHGVGDTPTGVLVDDRRLAVVSPRDGELRLFDLHSHDERSLAVGLMRNQRPLVTTTKTATGTPRTKLIAVRPAANGTFEIVAVGVDLEVDGGKNDSGKNSSGNNNSIADDGEDAVAVLAHTAPSAWITPVPRAASASAVASAATLSFITIDNSSDARLVEVAGTRLKTRTLLGAGVFRGAVLRADDRLLVERERHDDGGKATVLQLTVASSSKVREQQIVTGLPGLSPAVAAARAAASTGNKDGSIVVDDGLAASGGFVRWPGARVGVARPQAVTADGDIVVVTAIFRGQSLPQELWALTPKGGHALLTPKAGTVVTVYGISGGFR